MIWYRSPDRYVWVAEGPAGELLTVSKTFGGWVPGVNYQRGEPCATRTAAQRAAERMVAP